MLSYLTEHFTLDEFTHSDKAIANGLRNEPSFEVMGNLLEAARMMERIRSALGDVPITINSAYRSPEVNALVGGATRSDHVLGHAVDMVAPAFGNTYEIALKLSPQIEALGIGQLIQEVYGRSRWIHVSTRTPDNAINRAITIVSGRVQAGIQMVA